MKRWACIVAGLLALSAWAGTPGADYVLGVYDQITISVARHDEYNGTYTIPEMGRVNLPLVGEIVPVGKTIAALQAELAQRISERLNNPDVCVTLVLPRPRQVSVIGEVHSPGVLNLRLDWRVSEALAAAGGLCQPLEQVVCRLFRPGEPDRILDAAAVLRDGDKNQNVLLQEGDTVSVQLRKAIRVTVAGAVNKPDIYLMDIGSTAVEAISKAGGSMPNASLSRSFITRKGAPVSVDLQAAIVDRDPKANAELADGDTLTIPPHKAQVAVFGEVAMPGMYGLPEDRQATLSDALAQAGGVRKSGISSKIVVLRPSGGKTVQMAVDFRKYLKSADPAGNPPLQDGDVVVVANNRRADYEKLFGSILSLGLLGWLRR